VNFAASPGAGDIFYQLTNNNLFVVNSGGSSQLCRFGGLSGPTQWTVDQPGYLSTITFSGPANDGNLTITGLPSGLTYSLSGNTITIRGTPMQIGTFTPTVSWSIPGIPWASASATYGLTVISPTLLASDSNWSGYAVVPGAGVKAVGGTWVVPSVSGTGTAESSAWVGIDGSGSNTVEQIGTAEQITNGQPSYHAWYEMYGTAGPSYYEVPINTMSIQPGDTITAEVSFTAEASYLGSINAFLLQIRDTRVGGPVQYFSITQSSPVAQRASAEWIVEAPMLGGNEQPLANFGSVHFSGAWATVGSTTGPINAFANNYAITMHDPNGGGAAYPSTPPANSNTLGFYEPPGGVSSSGFTVTYANPMALSAGVSLAQASNGPVATISAGSGRTGATALGHNTDQSVDLPQVPWMATLPEPQAGTTPTSSDSDPVKRVSALDRVLAVADLLQGSLPESTGPRQTAHLRGPTSQEDWVDLSCSQGAASDS
jgi:hypothetical protein